MSKYMTTLCFVVLALLVPLNQSFADDDVLATTVEPFLSALKSGDIKAIQSFVSGPLSQNITEASGQNEDYGKFLRSRYAKATFYPTIIQHYEDKIIVSVNGDFAEEGKSVFELLIEKNSAGSWLIVDQYSPSTKN